jgi:hypothetical protein
VNEARPARGPLSWGDAITAVKELGIQDTSVLLELIELLGLTIDIAEVAESPETAETTLPPAADVSAPAEWQLPPLSPAQLEVAADLRTHVEELEAQPFDMLVDNAEPLVGPLTPTTIAYEPPIVETQLRAAIAALIKSKRRSNRIDMAKVVELIADQKPLTHLPFVDELTTRMGAIVVADAGQAMMPYLADVERFVTEVEHVVGSPNVAVVWADDDDAQPPGVPAGFGFETDRPVLVISTLGAVRIPGSTSSMRIRWLAFAESVEEAGANVVAIVPHRIVAWPDPIARAMRIVGWDDLAKVGRGA